jgi:hypothetical protein
MFGYICDFHALRHANITTKTSESTSGFSNKKQQLEVSGQTLASTLVFKIVNSFKPGGLETKHIV